MDIMQQPVEKTHKITYPYHRFLEGHESKFTKCKTNSTDEPKNKVTDGCLDVLQVTITTDSLVNSMALFSIVAECDISLFLTFITGKCN